jgi:hypothetical protein
MLTHALTTWQLRVVSSNLTLIACCNLKRACCYLKSLLTHALTTWQLTHAFLVHKYKC